MLQVPKWFSELDDLGFVDTDMYRYGFSPGGGGVCWVVLSKGVLGYPKRQLGFKGEGLP